MTISFDSSELRSLAFDLNESGVKALGAARGLVAKGALNIKTQMRAEMRASTHFKGAASSITYETTESATGVSAVIGPKVGSGEKGGHAGIAYGTGAYFGSSRGGGTVPDPQGALDKESPRFADALAKIIAGTI